ncbi:MAG: hypothetical protein ABJB05_12745 [Parafilimonas sp.]
MTKLFLLLNIFLLMSCDFPVPRPATEDQKKQVMNNVVFDQTLIAGINRYDNLKDFLLKYGDTIISYRDSRNYVVEVESANKMDTVLQKQDCYNFFLGNRSYDITNVPNFLRTQLDSIYHQIGDSNIKSFEVCKDGKINIEAKSEDRQNGLFISHNLMWNTKMQKDYAYSDNKDTLLNRNCIYRIGMTEDHGH